MPQKSNENIKFKSDAVVVYVAPWGGAVGKPNAEYFSN
jgi:hypothetical protein